ncbi:MAG: tetratricopeptide repeat protein, partial [Spirochaeta sp.]|nr:tetratricopeptide repeat protein [Spirochaeta sp.]
MKTVILMSMALLFSVGLAAADFQAVVDQADKYHDLEKHEEVKEFLISSIKDTADDKQKAELYWRLGRAYLNLGDDAEDNGADEKTLLQIFEAGEEAASKAIDLDSNNHLAYYWKSGNIGRWGQTKGILNSLFKAKPMRKLLTRAIEINPEHADSYYVLGQLYEQVPGCPVSFCNADASVSLGRKAVALHRQQVDSGEEDEFRYDIFTELAKHLYARNWKSAKRNKGQAKKSSKYGSQKNILEKNFYYEGTIELKQVTDRIEASLLLSWAVKELESVSEPTKQHDRDLKEAKELSL